MNNLLLSDVSYISPRDLVVHPRLIEIYGEHENRFDLEEDISKRGVILTPLIVSSLSNLVVSGKCRRAIAIKLACDSVPIQYVDCASEQEEEAWVLSLNLNRDGKTNFQKMVEAQHWESHFKPLAKKKSQLSAEYARKFLIRSNLTESDLTELDLGERINVRDTVAKKMQLSSGSYSNSKQVYKRILALQESGKLIAAAALEKELNRSIDAAYRFIKCEDYTSVINLIQSGEIGSVSDGIAWIRNGERNPFRKFKLDDIYMFSEETRPKDCSLAGRVVDITNEFVVFGFRNMSSWRLEIVRLRPKDIRAQVTSELSSGQRLRIYSLMNQYVLIEPVMVSLEALLKLPELTYKEEAYLRMLERNYDTNIRLVQEELGIVEVCGNKNTDIFCAA